ncbi:hypothetical protein JZO77_16140 [Enterococcus hulanensis]|uniref:Uncharacterized protein n=1 Tax=Enterococcus hulanensis TaxID=2559929 RepID=A0ABU3EXL9_9ENTE|nr:MULTISPECIES: hypothetical protein [Enterococcus]MBO0410837.1 hypothetical protein [Enterococcus hulanensis]MBO0458264.1 hypothetical protein [Enterococcus hulanensis]MBX8938906.1 hypothetical protein [Enterococcus gilvus]MDT2599614.1 hypothetical protein [Enterococcus hulanensis]MDT2609530.1 hypothetical protein [Enterococcus hulanensis]
MRGTVSNDQRVYYYESPFLMQGENGLTLSQLRAQFIKKFLNNPRAKYVTENYALEKDQRRINIWRKDGKILSEDELLRIDMIVPQIFETN